MIFKLAKANLLSNKKNTIISIAIMTLCLFLIIIVSNFAYGINQFCVDMKEVPINRTIMIDIPNYNFDNNNGLKTQKAQSEIDKQIELIENIDYISKLIKGNTPAMFQIIKNSEISTLDKNNWINSASCKPYYDFEELSLVAGRYPTDVGEIIIPKVYCPGQTDQILMSLDRTYNGEDFLGKTFDLRYYIPAVDKECETIDIKAKVVGVYDSASSFQDNNTFFLSNATFEKYINNNDSTNLYAIVDKTKNVSSVLDELTRQHISCSFCGADEGLTKFTNLFVAVCIFIVIIIAFVLAYCVKFLINASIKNNRIELAMLKSMGYKNKMIQNMLLLEYFIKLLLSFVLSLILSICVLFIFKEFFIKFFMNPMLINVHVSKIFFIVSFLIVLSACFLITTAVTVVKARKISKMSIVNAIKG